MSTSSSSSSASTPQVWSTAEFKERKQQLQKAGFPQGKLSKAVQRLEGKYARLQTMEAQLEEMTSAINSYRYPHRKVMTKQLVSLYDSVLKESAEVEELSANYRALRIEHRHIMAVVPKIRVLPKQQRAMFTELLTANVLLNKEIKAISVKLSRIRGLHKSQSMPMLDPTKFTLVPHKTKKAYLAPMSQKPTKTLHFPTIQASSSLPELKQTTSLLSKHASLVSDSDEEEKDAQPADDFREPRKFRGPLDDKPDAEEDKILGKRSSGKLSFHSPATRIRRLESAKSNIDMMRKQNIAIRSLLASIHYESIHELRTKVAENKKKLAAAKKMIRDKSTNVRRIYKIDINAKKRSNAAGAPLEINANQRAAQLKVAKQKSSKLKAKLRYLKTLCNNIKTTMKRDQRARLEKVQLAKRVIETLQKDLTAYGAIDLVAE